MNRFLKILTLVVLSQAFFVHAGELPENIFTDGFEFCTTGDADVMWDGGGDGVSWFDADNWSGNTLPVDGQTVVINVVDDLAIVYHDPDVTPQSLRIANLDSCNSISITKGILELDGSARVRRTVSISGASTLTVLNSLRTFLLDQSGGTVDGPGTVSVDGKFTWTAGQQSGTGETIAEDGMNLMANNVRDLDTRTLTLNGDSLWTATTSTGILRLRNAAVINNNGPFTIETDADMVDSTGDAATLNNTSTITKTLGSLVSEIRANFNNSGTITVNSGELWLGQTDESGVSGGDFVMGANGILGIRGSHNLTGSDFTGAGGFKYLSGGATTINGTYDVSGTLGVIGSSNGTLTFAIPVTIGDDVTVTGSGTLEFTAAPTAINADVFISGSSTLTTAVDLPIANTLQQSGGTLTGIGTVTVTDKFTWTAGQQSGTGETIAEDGMNLMANNVRDLDTRTLTLNGDSLWTATTSTGILRLRNAAVINNNGPFTIETDADMVDSTGDAATLNNTSTITKTLGSLVSEIRANFNNSGTITVNSGELWLGQTDESGVSGGDFVMGANGILGIRGSHNLTGSDFTGAGGFKYLSGGATTINGTYDVSGTLGVIGSSNGTLTFAIPVTIGDDVTVTGSGTLEFTAAPTAINADVFISGSSTLTTAVDLPIANTLQQSGGTLTGIGTVTVTDKFTWTAGQQSGTGETIAEDGMNLMANNVRDLDTRTLTLNGDSLWTATTSTGILRLRNAAVINNNGPFTIETDADMVDSTGDAATLNNTSTITKTLGSLVSEIRANFNNSGTITVNSGELWLGQTDESGVSGGDFVMGANGILGIRGSHNLTGSDFTGAGGFKYLSGGATTINGTYDVSGTLGVIGSSNGTLTFAIPVTIGDDVTVTGSGTLEFTAAPTAINADVFISGSSTLTTAVDLPIANTLQQSGGTLTGIGTVTVTDKFTWTAGQQSGTGETIAEDGMNLMANNVRDLDTRTLTLNGDSLWTATTSTGILRLRNAAVINNNGPFTIETDADMVDSTGDAATLNNTSTITKTLGSLVSEIRANFNNSGTITVNSGELWLGQTDESGVSGGDFVMGANGILGIRGSHNLTGSDFTGAGGFKYLSGGATTINGTYDVSGTLGVIGSSNGTLTFAIPVTIGDDVTVTGSGTLEFTAAPTAINADVFISGSSTLTTAVDLPIANTLQQSGGTLTGIGTVTVTDKFTWTAGQQSGTGETVAEDGMNLMANNVRDLDTRTLTLNGDSLWTATTSTGILRLRNAAVINNNGPFTIETDADMVDSTGDAATLNNTSSITKNIATGLTEIQAAFVNTGSVTVNSGTLEIDGVLQ